MYLRSNQGNKVHSKMLLLKQAMFTYKLDHEESTLTLCYKEFHSICDVLVVLARLQQRTLSVKTFENGTVGLDPI